MKPHDIHKMIMLLDYLYGVQYGTPERSEPFVTNVQDFIRRAETGKLTDDELHILNVFVAFQRFATIRE